MSSTKAVNNQGDIESSNSNMLPFDEIGHAFVQQFYTTLSDFPEKAFQFYGGEASLLFNGISAKGHKAIQETIEKINFKDCKVRIFDVVGSSLAHNMLAFQVCGEMGLSKKPLRRFFQTFILLSPAANSFYLLCDLFQFVDEAFSMIKKINELDGSVTGEGIVEASLDVSNLNVQEMKIEETFTKLEQNGDNFVESKTPDESQTSNQQNDSKILQKNHVTDGDLNVMHKHEHEKKADDSQSNKEIQRENGEGGINKRQEHLSKKTWANVATNQPATHHRKTSPHQQIHNNSPVQSQNNEVRKTQKQDQNQQQNNNQQQYNKPPLPKNQNFYERNYKRPYNSNYNNFQQYRDPENVIYFSMLEKNNENPIIPDGVRELRTCLNDITSGVVRVVIKNSMRNDLKYAIGQFIMSSKEDVQAIYDACTKENDFFKFHVNVPSFKFKGDIILSCSKTTPDGVVLAPPRQYYGQQQQNRSGYNQRFDDSGFRNDASNTRYVSNQGRSRDRDYNGYGYSGNRQGVQERGNFQFVNRGSGYNNRNSGGGGYVYGQRRGSFSKQRQYQFRQGNNEISETVKQ